MVVSLKSLSATICGALWSACKIAVLASCVFNFVLTPYFECLLVGATCDAVELSSLSGVYARTVCVACFVCTAVACFRYGPAMTAYRRCMRLQDAYSPAGPSLAERRRLVAFDTAVVAACLAIIAPVNIARLVNLYMTARYRSVMVFFAAMYVQNLTSCMLEMRFVSACNGLHAKFADINREMDRMDARLQADDAGRTSISGPRDACVAVERLKIRHRLVRQALDELNDLFAVPAGASLITLCVMALFDTYYYVTHMETTNTTLFIYMWLLQYMFRFFMIVKMAHATTKQVNPPQGRHFSF